MCLNENDKQLKPELGTLGNQSNTIHRSRSSYDNINSQPKDPRLNPWVCSPREHSTKSRSILRLAYPKTPQSSPTRPPLNWHITIGWSRWQLPPSHTQWHISTKEYMMGSAAVGPSLWRTDYHQICNLRSDTKLSRPEFWIIKFQIRNVKLWLRTQIP